MVAIEFAIFLAVVVDRVSLPIEKTIGRRASKQRTSIDNGGAGCNSNMRVCLLLENISPINLSMVKDPPKATNHITR